MFSYYFCSSILEASLLFAEMVQHGLRCIAFCKSRKLSELVLCYTYVTNMSNQSKFIVCMRLFALDFMCRHSFHYLVCDACFDFYFSATSIGVTFFRRLHPIWLILFMLIVVATLHRYPFKFIWFFISLFGPF